MKLNQDIFRIIDALTNADDDVAGANNEFYQALRAGGKREIESAYNNVVALVMEVAFQVGWQAAKQPEMLLFVEK